ncbi:ATP-grasp domain-containing protein [Nocardia sp. NPDC050435]|uniref:ATP-grasp domain-containing protein n=1 Tax=Nocardia sp. NPDC050435 TaxID=3155040 RepID=UPI0033C1ECB2
MSDTITLVVPNIAEFNIRHPRLALDPATENNFIVYGEAMAEQSAFWTMDPRILLMPSGIDRSWFTDVHRALEDSLPPVLSPARGTGRITEDLLADVGAMAQLRDHLRDHQRVQLASWGATEDLYRLITAIRGFGHEVLLDVPEAENYWSSLYFDSKQSCVDLALEVPGLRVASTISADTWPELRGALELFRTQRKKAIVRSRYGASGEGTSVVEPSPAGLEMFWRSLRDDPLLRLFPLLVQEYLPHHEEHANPAVDMLLTDEGVADLVLSVMTVDSHRFVSVNIGAGLISQAVAEEIDDLSRRIAAIAIRMGFRGWFGIDFLLDDRGLLHVTEFNARRTGGTQWIPLLDRWNTDRQAVAHAAHALPVPAAGSAELSYSDLRPAFQELQDEGVTVFPTAIRLLNHYKPSYGIVTGGVNAAGAEHNAAITQERIAAHLAKAAIR